MCLLLLSSLSKVFFRQQSWSHPRPDGICRYIHGRLVVLIQPMSGLSFKLVQCWCLILLICVTMSLKHFLSCYIKLFTDSKIIAGPVQSCSVLKDLSVIGPLVHYSWVTTYSLIHSINLRQIPDRLVIFFAGKFQISSICFRFKGRNFLYLIPWPICLFWA